MKRFAKALLLSCALVLGATLVLVAFCWYWVELQSRGHIYAQIEQLPKRKVLLVLGTSPGTQARPNRFFEYRMDAAARIYHAGKVEQILVSGEKHNAYYNEVQSMREALIARAVPEQVIELDPDGLRTLDSVYNAKERIAGSELLIVSQGFHVARAIVIARHRGMDAIGYGAQDVELRAGLRTVLRELGARVKMAADLYIFQTESGVDPLRLPYHTKERKYLVERTPHIGCPH